MRSYIERVKEFFKFIWAGVFLFGFIGLSVSLIFLIIGVEFKFCAGIFGILVIFGALIGAFTWLDNLKE